jgi:ERCC4-type nuclease
MNQTPIPCPFTILVDGREKAPFTFTAIQADADRGYRPLAIARQWAHLETGDYTIEGMEDLVAVERKSLEDLYSTLGQHRQRFEREMQRLAAMEHAAVVIEADWWRILQRPPPQSKLLPKTVFRTALSWAEKYGVHWLAMPDRRMAEITTFRVLECFYNHKQKKETKHASNTKRRRR